MSDDERRDETLESVNTRTRRAWDLAAERYHELFHDEMSGKHYDLAVLGAIANGLGSTSRVLDAGCGPCASAGRIVHEKGIPVTGVDLSGRCVELARAHVPGMKFAQADLANLPFRDGSFQGILSYYSILDTPKRLVPRLMAELRRVLAPGGRLVLVVKAGGEEGWQGSLLDIASEIWVSTFSEPEVKRLLEDVGFAIDSLETREPYAFEIEVKRIYAVAHVSGAAPDEAGDLLPRG